MATSTPTSRKKSGKQKDPTNPKCTSLRLFKERNRRLGSIAIDCGLLSVPETESCTAADNRIVHLTSSSGVSPSLSDWPRLSLLI